MSGKYKIKTVKEFLKGGPPQFDVILRREAGKSVDVKILMHPDTANELEGASDVDIVLNPPENGNGIIQIVKRISDDAVFHQSDMVEAENVGSCFIIEFKEDLTHVSVASLFDQEPTLVEINKLTAHELSIVDGESEDEQAEG